MFKTRALTLDAANNASAGLLDPCARCGDRLPQVRRLSPYRGVVRCVCGEQGGEARTVSGAVIEWNKEQRRQGK